MQEMSKEEYDGRVAFSKPDWHRIEADGKVCVDMHFHTSCSDSFTDVKYLMKLAEYRRTGVAVTDHNLISSIMSVDPKDVDVMLIPGIEVSTSDGPHILVYFYDRNDLRQFWTDSIRPNLQSCPWLALKDMGTEKLLDALEGENCVISAAHPMGYLGSNKGAEICNTKGYLSDELIERLDAYEVISGGMTRASNICACTAAGRHGLGLTGGTDGHVVYDVGKVVSVSDATDLDGFLSSVLKGTNTVVGVEKNIQDKIFTGSTSMSKFLKYAPSVGYIQIMQATKSFRRAVKRK